MGRTAGRIYLPISHRHLKPGSVLLRRGCIDYGMRSFVVALGQVLQVETRLPRGGLVYIAVSHSSVELLCGWSRLAANCTCDSPQAPRQHTQADCFRLTCG